MRFVKDQNKPGVIITKTPFPRSYIVETDDGIIRRNRRFITPLPDQNINQQLGHTEENTWENNEMLALPDKGETSEHMSHNKIRKIIEASQ